jgi:hypothetical protein
VQLHQPAVLEQFVSLSARIVVLSFAPLSKFQKWIPHFRDNFLQPKYQEQNLPFPDDIFARTRFVSNPDLSVYHAYGLDKNKPQEVYSRKVLLQYARWKLQGKPVHIPEEDPLQRGGDFVVNAAGILILSHTGKNQAERPSTDHILQALAEEVYPDGNPERSR